MRRTSFEYRTLALLIALSPLFYGCGNSTLDERQGIEAKAKGDAALALNGCVVSSEVKTGTAQQSYALQSHNQVARGYYATAIDQFAKAKASDLRKGNTERVNRIDGYLREIETKLRGCDSVMTARTGAPSPIAVGMSYTDTSATAPRNAAPTGDATDPMGDLRNRP